jgi:hypothetical protein
MATMPQQLQFAQSPNAFAQRLAPQGGRPPGYVGQPPAPRPIGQPAQPWGGLQTPVQLPPMGGAQFGGGGQPAPQPMPAPAQPMQPVGMQSWGGQPPMQGMPPQMPNAYAMRMMQQPQWGGWNG